VQPANADLPPCRCAWQSRTAGKRAPAASLSPGRLSRHGAVASAGVKAVSCSAATGPISTLSAKWTLPGGLSSHITPLDRRRSCKQTCPSTPSRIDLHTRSFPRTQRDVHTGRESPPSASPGPRRRRCRTAILRDDGQDCVGIACKGGLPYPRPRDTIADAYGRAARQLLDSDP
jgi:hypothetical protein